MSDATKGPVVILDTTMCYEGLYDLPEAVGEATDENFNPIMGKLPSDDHGIIPGTFRVQIIWEADPE